MSGTLYHKTSYWLYKGYGYASTDFRCVRVNVDSGYATIVCVSKHITSIYTLVTSCL